MFAYSFNQKFSIASALFIAAGTMALWLDEPLLMLIPFAWIIVPGIFAFTVYKTEWLYYGLFALLPLSTEINFTPSLGMDLPDELLMMLVTGIFIIKIIHKPSLLPRTFYEHPLILLLILHLAWLVIACYFSMDVWLSLKFVLAKTWFIVPFVLMPLIFFKTKKSIKTLALLLIIPMAFVVVQCLIKHSFYSFSFEGIKETLSPFFRNHVTYSAMLVCLLVVCWAMYVLTPKENKYRKWLMRCLWIGVIAIILSFSRGAWVALILGVIAAWAIRKKIIGWFITACIIITTITILWLMTDNRYLRFASDFNTTIFHKDFGEHLEATVHLKDVSNAERFYRWTAAANMVAEKPWTGFGPNNFCNYYKPYAAAPFKTWVSDNPEHSSVHNYFLLTALEQGIPGLVFFCLLFFGMILFSQKLYHSFTDRFYKTVSLSIGIILVMIGALIFMSDLIETDKIGSLFWLCLGLLVVLFEKEKEEQQTGLPFA